MITDAIKAGHYPVLVVGDLELRLDNDRLIMVSIDEDSVIEASLVHGEKGQHLDSIEEMTISSDDASWVINLLKRGDRNDLS